MTKRLSASRLNNFLGCEHHASLWLAGEEPPEANDAALELLRTKGFDHEAVVLASLEHRLGPAVLIPDRATLEERGRLTREAIEAGAPLIYQGALFTDRWLGFPDFLVRSGQSPDGRSLYEPEDAKLARSAKPEYLLQLGVYAELLEQDLGIPRGGGAIHVAMGVPERFDLRQTAHITRRLMRKFETFADQETRNTKAVKCAACAQCPFQSRCEAEWRGADSPTFVAGIRGAQIIKLAEAGVATMTELAALEPEANVQGIGRQTLPKLVAQAGLQKKAASGGQHLVEMLPAQPSRGFHLLPAPAKGDLFFDMEGDPHIDGGLEYLFGLWGPLGENGEDVFQPIWGHDRAGEKAAFEALMGLFVGHLEQYPHAHIYHYANYEPEALRRLAMDHATKEPEVDQLLREHRFVDLYRVATQSIRASTEGYSLKDLEKIYWGGRSGAVTNAGDSIVEYERWRVAGDPAILAAIAAYNEDDCVSTARLRDWLEDLRPPGVAYDRSDDAERGDPFEREEREAARLALAEKVRASQAGDERVRDLVAELLWFHKRSQKPQWWSRFDRQLWSVEEHIDDVEGLGGLTLDPKRPPRPDKRSTIATYRFPPQETKLRAGATCSIADTLVNAGKIIALEPEDGVIELRRGVASGPFPERCSLSPNAPLDQAPLVNAVASFAERYAAGELDEDRALMDFLMRRPPRIRGRAEGQPIIAEGDDLTAASIRAVQNLDRSALFIQGPPGTGKTYTASHAILALLKAGKRVAVSSNSHKAIDNLLKAVVKCAKAASFEFVGAKKAGQDDEEGDFDGALIETVSNSRDIHDGHQLVGATAFHLSLPAERGGYDYLFVDEAGQVALGNLVAMAGCALNLVLVGDQMQLPQPVQGVHPGQSGLSCLDYLLEGRATVPTDQGILLNVSRRMRPELCRFISEAVYDGRLSAHPDNSQRKLIIAGASNALRPAGLAFVSVDHEGCTQSSPAEAKVVRGLVDELLTQSVRRVDSSVERLKLGDILVVAPFNMQVNLLKRMLPAGAKVGTVDMFQGQEEAVVIVSMATSVGADAPRGTKFIFDRNRFNVALSRAQCLAIVVHSERLLEAPCNKVEDLRRLDLFAWAEATAVATVSMSPEPARAGA
jgi:uncharacterized protein